MRHCLPAVALLVGVAGCAGHDRLRTVDTRAETVDLQQLRPEGGGGAGRVEAYVLNAGEGYRMPQLYAAPDPVLGDRDPRRELAPTKVCLQVVVDAEGNVQRSLPLTDRDDCAAGKAPENAALVQAAQDAVAMWRYTPAAVCRFAAGTGPASNGGCTGAAQVEPVPVSLFYAFTFEIVKGTQTVTTR
ncbi:hypothetical protein [Stenotrophomonas sp.]|uniref:energy transducer TonB n=1 Tax=Stenotrophomonas sp. TaxID=69392 RepID=UPI0028A86C61|nr:hypothetical protein [Stenotrophomonas sp.]